MLSGGKIIAVRSEIHTKSINKLCGHKVEFLNVICRGAHSYRWAFKGLNELETQVLVFLPVIS